ncbi:NADH-quinone oxidoreductase subunit J family protein [Acidicapsa acidisoli]|uniref:NADH-quinone oxidoreductase subunit J family protein n=1 Tax=Acidicapsa acidisoli TaxID=1615681 RepID=UPI0021DF4B86|nr:NADH-quinone oxidoreductase subunit J [Acidicapsa acidisoli]
MIFGLSAVFLLTAALTVAGALAAALLKNLVHCALSLTVTFAGLALLYLQLDAQFAGFSQILVYIGAVAILVVFAILLTRGAGIPEYRGFSSSWLACLVIAAAVFALLAWSVIRSLPANIATSVAPAVPAVSVQSIGAALMSTYVLPLEIVAVVLTVALIGAVIVAMPETRTPRIGADTSGAETSSGK